MDSVSPLSSHKDKKRTYLKRHKMVHSFYDFVILYGSPSGRLFVSLLLEKTGFWPVLMSPFFCHPTCSDIILDIYLSIAQNLLNISSLQTGITVTHIYAWFFLTEA